MMKTIKWFVCLFKKPERVDVILLDEDQCHRIHCNARIV